MWGSQSQRRRQRSRTWRINRRSTSGTRTKATGGQVCAAGAADDWQNIDGAAAGASSHSAGWLGGYLACKARPVTDAINGSDFVRSARATVNDNLPLDT
jgi:hypothetical protein